MKQIKLTNVIVVLLIVLCFFPMVDAGTRVDEHSFDRLVSFINLLNNNMNRTRREVVQVEEVLPPSSGGGGGSSKPSRPVYDPDDFRGDFRGRIYNIGTSISNGGKFHNADHSQIKGGGSLDGFFNYYFDERMINTYFVLTDTCDWYRDRSWKLTWDKYNLCSSGGDMNTYTLANGEDPFPLNSSAAGRGMCLDCVDDLVNMTWGRGLFRTKDLNWSSDVSFLIVEGGHHDQNILWEGENASGMAEDIIEIYEQSLFFNYTLVLLGHLPVGKNTNQNISVVHNTNIWRKEFSENHTGLVYVDFTNSSFYKMDGSANESFFVESDKEEVHPNKLGFKVMGELIADAIFSFMVDNNMLKDE